MKKIIVTIFAIVSIVSMAIYAHTNEEQNVDNAKIANLETLAQQGDTAAMHRLIEFYDENSEYIIERELTEAEKLDYQNLGIENATDTVEIIVNELYSERLDYWLEKGIAINDPVALSTKGMRLYYEDEAKAIYYLSRAADNGNAQAALFCGSALYNQGQIGKALKYLKFAYDNEIPSAGWHLAMCLSRSSQALDKDLIIDCLRHSANLNYPEAVIEMRRIEPTNPVWQHKADSLEIDFPDFLIIE